MPTWLNGVAAVAAGALALGCHRGAGWPRRPAARVQAPAALVLRSMARPAGHRVSLEPGEISTSDDAQSVWRTLGAIARHHARDLGWSTGDETAEAVPTSASGPTVSAGTTALKVYHYLQQARGFSIVDGHVSVLAGGGQLLFTQGKLHARAPVEALMDRLLAARPPAYEAGLAIVQKTCGEAKAEPPGDRQSRLVDPEGARLLYIYACGPGPVAWDPLAGKVVRTWSTRHAWTTDDDGVDVRAVKDGDPTSPPNEGGPSGAQWFHPDGYAGIPPELTQIFHHVLVDWEPRAGSPGNCNYRMTYGGGASIPPFPRLQDHDGHTLYASGSCSSGGSAFTVLDDKVFEYQTVFERLIAMARYAAWSQDFGVFAWWPANDLNKVNATVHKTDGHSCDVAWAPWDHDYRAGWQSSGQLCFDAAHPSWNRWLVVPHEYGHYIAESYGMIHSTLFESCDAGAIDEAVADALALSFVHYRADAARLNDTLINRLFVNGPGQIGANVGGPADFATVDGECSDANHWTRMRAVAQVLWSLLTNRYCHGWLGKVCNTEPILDPISSGCGGVQARNTLMAEIARQALTFAIVSDPDNASDFLWDMRAFILIGYADQFSPNELERLNAVFDAHHLVPPA